VRFFQIIAHFLLPRLQIQSNANLQHFTDYSFDIAQKVDFTVILICMVCTIHISISFNMSYVLNSGEFVQLQLNDYVLYSYKMSENCILHTYFTRARQCKCMKSCLCMPVTACSLFEFMQRISETKSEPSLYRVYSHFLMKVFTCKHSSK
jgi:hypothetical protein